MNTLKLAITCKKRDVAKAYAAEIGAVLFTSNSPSTDHLPFAAMIIGTTDDLEKAQAVGDAGCSLARQSRTARARGAHANDSLLSVRHSPYVQWPGAEWHRCLLLRNRR